MLTWHSALMIWNAIGGRSLLHTVQTLQKMHRSCVAKGTALRRCAHLAYSTIAFGLPAETNKSEKTISNTFKYKVYHGTLPILYKSKKTDFYKRKVYDGNDNVGFKRQLFDLLLDIKFAMILYK